MSGEELRAALLGDTRTLGGCAYCFDPPKGHLHEPTCDNGNDDKHHEYVTVRSVIEARAALAAPSTPEPSGPICGHVLSNGDVCTEKPHGEDRGHATGNPFGALRAAASTEPDLNVERLRTALNATRQVHISGHSRDVAEAIAAEYARLAESQP